MPISIIIPSTGKRTDILYETLRAALAAIAQLEGEIILITSPEKPVPLTSSKLHVVRVDFNNVSASRNLGAKTARFDTLLFIDDDMLISEDNVVRLLGVVGSLKPPFLMNLAWTHTDKVWELKQKTTLGKLVMGTDFNGSLYNRYTTFHQMSDWQDGALFESSLRREFSEGCFVMSKAFFLKLGGFNEEFHFEGDGTGFLAKLQPYDWHYYIDALNVVGHNEWDKFSDWDVLRVRQAGYAAQVTKLNGKSVPEGNKYKNGYYKLFYGTLFYSALPLTKSIIEQLPVEGAGFSLAQTLYMRCISSLYWHAISWKTILRQITKPPARLGHVAQESKGPE